MQCRTGLHFHKVERLVSTKGVSIQKTKKETKETSNKKTSKARSEGFTIDFWAPTCFINVIDIYNSSLGDDQDHKDLGYQGVEKEQVKGVTVEESPSLANQTGTGS